MSKTITITQAQLERMIDKRVSALLSDSTPAKPAKVAKARKAPVTRHLVKKNRADFVKAHAWAQGLSTLDIAIAVVHCEARPAKGWAIGEGYAEKAQGATKAAIKAVRASL